MLLLLLLLLCNSLSLCVPLFVIWKTKKNQP
jgi:hypothetical protein